MCTYLTWRAQNAVKKKNDTDKAMMLLLRRELREFHQKHMANRCISDDELGTFEEMYEVYHNLGGNGVGTVWKNDLEKLERR